MRLKKKLTRKGWQKKRKKKKEFYLNWFISENLGQIWEVCVLLFVTCWMFTLRADEWCWLWAGSGALRFISFLILSLLLCHHFLFSPVYSPFLFVISLSPPLPNISAKISSEIVNIMRTIYLFILGPSCHNPSLFSFLNLWKINKVLKYLLSKGISW